MSAGRRASAGPALGPGGMWKNLGTALGLVRGVRGRSQNSVAREAGIGKSQLSKYENGRELPKLESLERVLNVLKVSPFEFFYALHVVDGRVHDLNAREAVPPEAPSSFILHRGTSLLSPEAEQSFASVMAELLKLYRAWVELTLSPPPDPPTRKARQRAP